MSSMDDSAIVIASSYRSSQFLPVVLPSNLIMNKRSMGVPALGRGSQIWASHRAVRPAGIDQGGSGIWTAALGQSPQKRAVGQTKLPCVVYHPNAPVAAF